MPNVQRDGANLYYERHGAGPAILFAHGAGGNTLSWWQQIPHFAPRYTTITLDHRLFGRSTGSPDAFHPAHFADDALAVLDACGIERAAFVCQSMGGWTGLRCAVEHPDRVAALVLCGTPGGLRLPAVLEAAASIGQRATAEGIRGNAALAPDYPARRPDMAFLYDQIAGHNSGFEPGLLGRMFDERGSLDPAALDDYATPTLMLAGEEDQLFPPSALREVAAHLPGAVFHELPGLGHSTYFEAPQAFNALVDGFLASHHPSGRS